MQDERKGVGLPEKEEIERALKQIVGVEAARVCLDDGEIAEIHIAASPGSRPKSVMRDVRSYLAAALGIEVDHKKISIAVLKPCDDHRQGEPSDLGEGGGSRIRFQSIQVLVEGLRAEVQVRLRAEGRALCGIAEGVPAANEVERLAVRATLDALQSMMPPDVRLLGGEVRYAQVGEGEVFVVEVRCVRERSERRLIGACRVEADRLRGAVFATLDALNRVLGLLSPPGWTEVRVGAESAEREEEGIG
ncbi:MAG: hypothetical protein V1774_05270 [Candidatus Eisenbacteria bacterium]